MSNLYKRILRGIYGRSPDWFCEKYRLVRPENLAGFTDFEYYAKGLIVGVAGDFPGINSNSLVLGGVCIDHCDGNMRRITFQVVADCWIAMLTAIHFGLPCLIILPDYEEVLCNGAQSQSTWERVGDFVYSLIRDLSSQLNLYVRIARTMDSQVKQAIDSISAKYEATISKDSVINLYRVNYFGIQDFTSYNRLTSLKRNLITTLPETTSELTGKNIEGVILAANIQQVRAFVRARDLFHSLNGDSVKMSQLVFVPSVSLSGKERMSRSRDQNKIFVDDKGSTINHKLHTAHNTAAEYWTSIIPKDLNDPAKSINIGDVLAKTVVRTNEEFGL